MADKKTSPKVASAASKVLSDKRQDAASKSVAASALAQSQPQVTKKTSSRKTK